MVSGLCSTLFLSFLLLFFCWSKKKEEKRKKKVSHTKISLTRLVVHFHSAQKLSSVGGA